MARIGHAHKNKKGHAKRNPLICMVRPLGLEPRAHGLKAPVYATSRTIVIGLMAVKQIISELKNTVAASSRFKDTARFGHVANGGLHAYL